MNAARRTRPRTSPPEALGLICPVCGQSRSRIIDTAEGPGYVRRRRLCLTPSCLEKEQQPQRGDRQRVVKGVRWTTYERLVPWRARPTVSRGTNATNRVFG